jgi:protease I
MLSNALIIIAQKGFQDIELAGTRAGLSSEGFSITLASKEVGECIGKFGGSEQATVAMRDVDIADYDRIVFIGGPGAGALKDDPDALRLAHSTVNAGKILGAICIAPTILAAAGVLKGKRVTGWDDAKGTQIRFLEEHGAEFVDAPVVTDGLIVTGNGPEAAEEFGKALAAL